VVYSSANGCNFSAIGDADDVLAIAVVMFSGSNGSEAVEVNVKLEVSKPKSGSEA
jgi:hypothetical protein